MFVFTSTGGSLPELSKTRYSVKNLKVRFVQAAASDISTFTHYPYALYFDTVGAIAIDMVTIEAAWNAVNLTDPEDSGEGER